MSVRSAARSRRSQGRPGCSLVAGSTVKPSPTRITWAIPPPGCARQARRSAQGLEHDSTSAIAPGSDILPVAAAGERCRPDRAAEIEGEDLRAVIPPELQRRQRRQDRFALPVVDDQRMADIADMGTAKRAEVEPSVRA